MDPATYELDIPRILRGDKLAIGKFVSTYSPVFRGIARRIVKGGSDEARIEDLVQDVWMAFVESKFRPLELYIPDRGRALKGYLSQFAYFRILDRLRHDRATTKNINVMAPDDLARVIQSEDYGMSRQEARDTWAAISRFAPTVLSEADLKFFRDSFMEERPVPELAENLGVSPAAIHTRRGRVRKVMVELLYKRILDREIPDDSEKH